MHIIIQEYSKAIVENGLRLIHEWQRDIIGNRTSSNKVLLDLSDVAYWQLIAIRDTLYILQKPMYEYDEFDDAYLIEDTINIIDKQIALVWAFEMKLYRF